MKRRHWTSDNEATSDLASAAAEAALVHAELQATDVDCFIVATVTPDYYFPATACLVATRLGVREKPAFDIAIACSGFIYGLTIASGLIRSGVYRRVMLIGAESLSKILDKERSLDRHSFRRWCGRRDSRALRAGFVSRLRSRRRRQPPRTALRARQRIARADRSRGARREAASHPHARARNVQARRQQDGRIDRLGLEQGEPHQSRRLLPDSAPSEQAHHRRDRAVLGPARR